MSKRYKVRKRNAAKQERSREVIDQFYGNVIAGLELMSECERLRIKTRFMDLKTQLQCASSLKEQDEILRKADPKHVPWFSSEQPAMSNEQIASRGEDDRVQQDGLDDH